MKRIGLTIFILVTAFSSPIRAQETIVAESSQQKVKDWTFSVDVFGWLSGVRG